MASLILSTAGSAIGGSIGGPIGAMVGRTAGAVAGSMIDQALFGNKPSGGGRHREGPRLSDLEVSASTEGAPVPRVYGRARLAGQLIWATNIEEVVSTQVEVQRGGKGGGGGRRSSQTTTTTTYSYFANLAVGVCEGPVSRIGRIWMDGKLIDQTGLNIRLYRGDSGQQPDPLILAHEGAGGAPAYRGLAYVVFEKLPLAAYGNRIPQIQIEVIRAVGRLEKMIRAVTLIPGSTEFGYDTVEVVQRAGAGVSRHENRHQHEAPTDWTASLDDLQALCPNLERVALVASWFGSDLRAGVCTIRPGVENRDKFTHAESWQSAGETRGSAYMVSQSHGRPAYGGTPSDATMIRAITDLKQRGLGVTLYPFVMMDIPAGNSLPSPYGGSSQPAYPWRGRITCFPAPNQSGTPDGTMGAAAQVAAFFGTAQPAHFSLNGTAILYTGPAEWSYRRFILHMAWLAKAAGGVDAFVIGSELKALTRVRSASGVYPAVTQLIALAADVRTILGAGCKITYAADWTEYGAHVVDAAAQEVRFPLDPLWASPHLDAIGIDYYAPLSDWRDGSAHLDAAQACTPCDLSYLTANLRGGEAFDYYYPDTAARTAQTRVPITDGLGKPWIYRPKDILAWWSQPHHERVGGAELPVPTSFVPATKPVWLTETGCPAVDKGANQPSVFPDPKSAEAGLPWFSSGRRDDTMQRRYLEAVIGGLDPAFGGSLSFNPAGMIDPAHIYLWTWDARPYPAFPADLDTWSDGVNWDTGHWLTGRLGAAPLSDLVQSLLNDAGIFDALTHDLAGGPAGYVLDRPMSPRAALDPLGLAYQFDAHETGGVLTFRMRGGIPVSMLDEQELVQEARQPLFRLVRAEDEALPEQTSLGFLDEGRDYRRASAMARRRGGTSRRVADADMALITSNAEATRCVESWLRDLWAGRDTLDFRLPPSRLALTPGDVVSMTLNQRTRLFEITESVDAQNRELGARSIDPAVFDVAVPAIRRVAPTPPPSLGPAMARVLDLPALPSSDPDTLQHLALFADPWPGPMAIWRSTDGSSFTRVGRVDAPAVMGETLTALAAGPTSCWDKGNRLRVQLYGGQLVAESQGRVLDGANAAAVRHSDGAWEVIQFSGATLVGPKTYELFLLLRGQAGTEHTVSVSLPAGAPFVLLNDQVRPLASGLETLERPFRYRIGALTRDHNDPSVIEVVASATPRALQPYAPVHVRGKRAAGGIEITWVRRTLTDGDSWQTLDVPLHEDREAYRLEIVDGATVVRSFETSLPLCLYPTAQELADFDTPQTTLNVRIVQLSGQVGAGVPVEATLSL